MALNSAPDSLTPDEAQRAREAGVDPAVALLLRGHGSDLQPLEGLDPETYTPYPAPGLTVAIPEAHSVDAVNALRDGVAPGYVAFRSERDFSQKIDRVAVLRADDPFAPLRVMGTNGANFDIETDQVIERIREWDARFGLRLTSASMDWLEAEFVRPPEDMLAFAHEVYDFCPDVVDQGTESIEALADEMRSTNTVYLWWD
ncbi:DUF4253 domain-containing protein [Longimicrobium sp.]|uniref:DUF4253 domain-containing protein n=1 Tax=Longimicrobium sp. TaxID=2029185 RepID=UPI002E3743EE|nr:DUF4253 domain-containing protein [Longimicrobium sp.]HEX6039045.1 DUF4253 domain-containing protein [Longimicrobium sp.]